MAKHNSIVNEAKQMKDNFDYSIQAHSQTLLVGICSGCCSRSKVAEINLIAGFNSKIGGYCE